MNEQSLLKKFLLEFSRQGSRLFRCNTGMAYTSSLKPIRTSQPRMVKLEPGDVLLKKARPFQTGWPKGTPDLLGFTSVTIQQDMVGKTVAVFTGVEVKSSKRIRITKEQHAFVRMINDKGGIATIAYGLDDYLKAVTNFKDQGVSNGH